MYKKQVGILAIQGSFIEHATILRKLKIPFIFVRTQAELKKITHLIIPGGESTTLTKLLNAFGLWQILKEKLADNQIKIFGTCAGAILCAKLGMGIEVQKNGYGSQLESFIDQLDSNLFPGLTGVFIRAPRFISVNPDVGILASHNNEPVLTRQNNFLAAAFHPELCGETRLHNYFLNL